MTILVVVKEPLPGRVKTRLTPPYHPGQAAAIAAAAIADTLDTVAASSRVIGIRPVVVLDGSPGRWLPAGFKVVRQSDGPFDERLAAAFDGADGPTLLIGMDTPQVSTSQLVAAYTSLKTADAVLGPAYDGGWWALGLRRPEGDLLRGVPTSTPTTGATQRRRLRDAGLDVVDLPTLRDVDVAADVTEVARLVPTSRFAAATRAAATASTPARPVRQPR